MIQGYKYNPHSSLPQALRDFCAGQGRKFSDAVNIDVREVGEHETYYAQAIGSTPEKTRISRVEFADGFLYDLWLVLLDEDSWCVRYVDVWIKVPWNFT